MSCERAWGLASSHLLNQKRTLMSLGLLKAKKMTIVSPLKIPIPASWCLSTRSGLDSADKTFSKDNTGSLDDILRGRGTRIR